MKLSCIYGWTGRLFNSVIGGEIGSSWALEQLRDKHKCKRIINDARRMNEFKYMLSDESVMYRRMGRKYILKCEQDGWEVCHWDFTSAMIEAARLYLLRRNSIQEHKKGKQ